MNYREGEKLTLAWAKQGGFVGAFVPITQVFLILRENVDRVAHSSTSTLFLEHILPVHGCYPHQPPF